MARNFVQPGNIITMPAPAAASGGDVVIMGDIIGIAAGDAAIGADLDVHTGGVWELPKVSADDFTIGAPAYYDSIAELVTTTATGNTKIGTAVAAAGNGVAAVKVRLSGF